MVFISKKMLCFALAGALLSMDRVVKAPDVGELAYHKAESRQESERQQESKKEEESSFHWFKRKMSEHVSRMRDHVNRFLGRNRHVSQPDASLQHLSFDPSAGTKLRSDKTPEPQPRETDFINDNAFAIRANRAEAAPAVKDPRKELMRADVTSLESELDVIRSEMREVSPVEFIQRSNVQHMLKVVGLDPGDIAQEIESMVKPEQQQALIDHLFQKNGVVADSIESLALIRDYFSKGHYLPRVEEKLFEYLNEYRQHAEYPQGNGVLKYLIQRTMNRLSRIVDSNTPSVVDNFSQKDWEYATGGISKKERTEMEKMR